MKKINYYFSRGIEYGKIPATSYREGGKVRKKNDGIYLGKVIDKATGTFFNDEHGFFTYDPATGIYGPADERLTSDRIKDQRRRERILLDFGDSFFLSEVIKQMKYDTVIESMMWIGPAMRPIKQFSVPDRTRLRKRNCRKHWKTQDSLLSSHRFPSGMRKSFRHIMSGNWLNNTLM